MIEHLKRWATLDLGPRDAEILAKMMEEEMERAIHFVGFRGDEYNRAKRVWGEPDFIHRGWDKRARREIMDGDTVLFAKGPHDQQPDPEHNFPDLTEKEPD